MKRKLLLAIVSKRIASKIFTFDPENEQVYRRTIAEKQDNVMSLNLEGVFDIKFIDFNPANNPQPPQRTR